MERYGYPMMVIVPYVMLNIGDRPRMKPIFEFKTIKEGEYNHLNMHGKGHTNNSFLRDNIKMKTKSTVSNYIIGTILESKKRRIDEWI